MKKVMYLLALMFTLSVFFFTGKVITQKSENDHSDRISGPFSTAQDVTKACLECHEEQADNFMKTSHWTWLGDESEIPGKGKISVGKHNLFNNFYISLTSNESSCTNCHAGFGWIDGTFDFSKKENVDCLICHAEPTKYSKKVGGGGLPDSEIDLVKAAQSVRKPTKENCGKCHFYGMDGTEIKHGNLDPILANADKSADVHIGGQKFECTKCHKTQNHKITGESHSISIDSKNIVSCADCHKADESLHSNKLYAKHLSTVACETCHIPYYARSTSALTNWDWSEAGKKEDELNSDNLPVYSKKYGQLTWEKNLTPTYAWSNGSNYYYSIGEKIDPQKILEISKPNGSISEAKAKIYPFRIMKGKQIFDSKNNYLIMPKLSGTDGYWATFDWKKSAELGMKAGNQTFSGDFGFVSTIMYIPIHHTVMPKENALKCTECHGNGKRLDWSALGFPADPMKKGSRMKNGLITK